MENRNTIHFQERNQQHRKVFSKRRVAYFSMEIGIDPKIPTYSGGLGILAGDTVKSCADLGIPLVAVTLCYKNGYFYQRIDKEGQQHELPYRWDPGSHLRLLPGKIKVMIRHRPVFIQAWRYDVIGTSGHCIPVIFLDTNIDPNTGYDRSLTDYLYGGDARYRLAQEIVLGIGGVRMLRELGFNHIQRYHMNEGHASMLVLEILREHKPSRSNSWNIAGLQRMCVFTTHTPVPAGHDQFSYELVAQVLGEFVPFTVLKKLGGDDHLNMTLLALNTSHYINGVAQKHSEVSREMFPGYKINSITNGVHSATWVHESFRELYDMYIPGWRKDPSSFRRALGLPCEAVWNAHVRAKHAFLQYIKDKKGVELNPDVMTIGFGRRATAYKRADLIFFDIERLQDIARRFGRIQIVFGGKAHPQDMAGKEMMQRIISSFIHMKKAVKAVYLENYDIELAKLFISGVDLWLNTPQKPREASGTSGMKAAHNGIPSLSVLDGWWIEGCVEGVTGWAIGSREDIASDDAHDARSLYEKLSAVILPTFYKNRAHWIDIMRSTIAINASFFNTHRMVQEYVLNAYTY